MNEGLEPLQDQIKAVDVESTRVVESESDRLLETTTVVTESPSENVRIEEFKISGDDLVSRVRQLIHQGNIRRIIIKNDEGRTLIEVPLTVGVVGGVIGAALFPVIAAIGAIGAVVAHLTLVVERKE